MKKRVMIELICALLIFLFLYTAISKLVDYTRYYGQINGQPLPNVLTPFIVWTLPTIEILIAIGLMFSRTRLAALWSSFILLIIFTIYIGLILANTFEKIPCSCGGVLQNLTWIQHLWFNLFFILLTAAGIWLTRKPQKTSPVLQAI